MITISDEDKLKSITEEMIEAFSKGHTIALLKDYGGTNVLRLALYEVITLIERNRNINFENHVKAATRIYLEYRGFQYYDDPMEGGQDAYDVTMDAMEKVRKILTADDTAKLKAIESKS